MTEDVASNPCGDGIALFGAMMETHVFNGYEFYVRGSDRYWDATRMCQMYGKRVNNFLRIESTQRYLSALSKKLSIPIEIEKSAMTENQGAEPNALIYKVKGGEVDQSGTWVHQRVALKLAAWLNEDFEVWVYGVIEELMTTGQVKMADHVKELTEALQLKDIELEAVCNEYALLEHRYDRSLYTADELKRDMAWHRMNSWGGADR